ncbi:MAG: hypothetical protein U9P72_06960 [Campylobacterota bacterium]|nr:hypothetical protein [Campylobacterota bacterium]
MNIFKLLLITLFITSSLYSDVTGEEEHQDIETNWNYFGEFKTYFAGIHKEKDKEGVTNFDELLNYNSIQLHADYLNGNFYFSMTPYAYIYFTESKDELRGSNYTTPFKFKDFFFRSLYMSYSIDKLSFGVGILPFSNSSPMQYSSDYYQDGEGISTVSDLDPLAIFMKYRFSDTNKILAGIGVLDTGFIPGGKYIDEHHLKNSFGVFVTQTIVDDKLKIINDFKYTDVYYDGKQAGEFYNLGVGLSYDDSEYSGWTFYNALAFSLYENNSINVKDEILNNIGLSGVPSGFENSFIFDNERYTGASNIFGFRKDVDILDFESFINFEWFHIFGDWTSANKGALYNSNCTQVSNIRDDSFFINYGIRISELTTFKINYSYIQFDKIENIGAPSSTPVDESFGSQRSSVEILKISFSYKF